MTEFDLRYPIEVMEPVSRPEPFDDPDYLFQLKWDGIRMLARYAGPGHPVELQNRRGRIRTGHYPELERLVDGLSGHRAILDGEMVVIKDGRPSFQAVLRREQSGSGTDGLPANPVRFMVFDLLWLDGVDLRTWPLEDRLNRLGSVLEPGPAWDLVGSLRGEGTELFMQARNTNFEGIVAKRLGSAYTAGKKSGAWVKIKCFRTLPCVVAGLALKGGRPSALIVGAYRQGRLVCLGRVSSGLTEAELDRLALVTREIEADSSPFDQMPDKMPSPPGTCAIRYIKPLLVGRIRYLEWTDQGQLRSPVWEGFLDWPPDKCRI